MKQAHDGVLHTPWPDKPTKPLCIRIFLNDDDTQYGVEVVATWGTDPPICATTFVESTTYGECGECGTHQSHTTQEGTAWVLTDVIGLPFSEGVIGYYRRGEHVFSSHQASV